MAKPALLIVDVQEAMITGKMYRERETLSAIERLLAAARTEHVPVLFVRHDYGAGHVWEHGTLGWQIYTPLVPLPQESIIDKQRNSAFFHTELDALLKEREVDTLVICGVHTEYCIDATIRSACEREYAVIVPSEANTTNGNEYMTAERLHSYYNDFIWQRRYAQVLPIEPVLRILEGG